MNISKRDSKLLLILFGIVIFVLCYFLVYLGLAEENEFLEDDIQDAQFTFDRLKALEREVAGYNEAIAASEAFIAEAQAKYPSEIRTEDLIMYAVELRDNIGMSTGGISFIQPVSLTTVQGLAENDNGSYSFTPRNAFRTGFSMNLSLTYEQLKELVEYVYNDSPKNSIHSISLSYNPSTGNLYGNVVINMTFLSSRDEDYVAALIPEMSVGLPNPFGVIAPPAPVRPVTRPPVTTPPAVNPDI
jgi:hypothetical protein